MEQNYYQPEQYAYRSEQSIAQTVSAVMKQVYMKMLVLKVDEG